MVSSTGPASPASVSPADSQHGAPLSTKPVPVETLVQNLLDAKRSLSSMGLVLRANELVHLSRQAHEESVILTAQSQFLRRGISDQTRLLRRLRRSMNRTYEDGDREFTQILNTLDEADVRLEETIDILRYRFVDSVFRPNREANKNLLDFVDESQVNAIKDALKENIEALQNTQTSFRRDLQRFDDEMSSLNEAMSATPSAPSPSASSAERSLSELLADMNENSHAMADLLSSLTKHFDMCVTAVRITEGGVALARIKAAEVTNSQIGGDVSISGVIAEQELRVPDYDPVDPEARAQMIEIVVEDASEVEDVVRELNLRLQTMEAAFSSMDEQTKRIHIGYFSTLNAFKVLEDIGSRLHSYISAETEFRDRWSEEHQAIHNKLKEMENLRAFYESYASSYDGLILEVERRRALEDKVLGIWKKAKEGVDKIIETDRKEREIFRQEVAEYIPTDLWPGMDDGMLRWEIVPVRDDRVRQVEATRSIPNLGGSVVEAGPSRSGGTSRQQY